MNPEGDPTLTGAERFWSRYREGMRIIYGVQSPPSIMDTLERCVREQAAYEKEEVFASIRPSLHRV